MPRRDGLAGAGGRAGPDCPVNFGDLFAAHAGSVTVAVRDLAPAGGAVDWSYRDLDVACGQVAAGLAWLGIRPGARIGVMARNRVEYLCAYYGTMRAGATVVPLNIKLPGDQQRYVLDDAGVELVFADAEHAATVPPGRTVVSFDAPAQWAPYSTGPPAPSVDVAAGGVAIQMYTSGSTGRPKGVLLTHGGQQATFSRYIEAGMVPARSVNLVAAPLYHKNAAVSIKLTLVQGATAVLMPRFDAKAFASNLVAHRCTTVVGVPTMFALMLAERDHLASLDLSHVTRVAIGSAPLTEALLHECEETFPNAAVTNGFGTTEVIAVFGEHPDGRSRPDGLTVGHPLSWVQTALVGDDGRPVPDGRPGSGELWVSSPGVMAGYHGLPDATSERLRDGWYRTGDVFDRTADGWHYFVGRADDMFVCSGENVYPGEVEGMLERHPGIHQAAVVPVADRVRGALAVAFVVPVQDRAPSADEVRAFALENGPTYSCPRHVVFVAELPLAGTEKIDRRELVARAEAMFGERGTALR